MDQIPDNCVALMVTSPPYNCGKDYDQDLDLDEFMAMLESVITDTFRVLEPGGRVAINVANLGRKPYIPLNHHIAALLVEIGFQLRGEIIWQKAKGASGSTVWGTWQSARNPVLRDIHEYIVIASSASERQHRESLAHSRKEADRRDAARAYGNASDVLFRLARARAFLRPGNEDRSSFLSHISELRSESESVRSELRVIHVLGWSDEFREAVIQLETTMFSCMSLIDFIAQEVSDGSTSLEEADSRMEAALERTGPPLIEYRELMK